VLRAVYIVSRLRTGDSDVEIVRNDGKIEATGTDGAMVGFDQFVLEHYGRLVGLAGIVAGNVTAAEDIVQTALERAWKSRGSFRSDGSLRPWLDRIVVREAARERRWRLRWLGRISRPPSVTPIEPPFGEVVDPDASRFPERTLLRMVLDDLSAAHRAAVVLHLHAGYSVDETAEPLGVPRETVRSRLRVARERLRRALQEGV
jgi:RNA polymerase sigma-70 factor (ECF subfamily)